MKIYVSPSVQDWNKGVGNYGTEEQRMNQLADLVVPLLRLNGFEVYRNKPEMNLQQVVDDSNSKITSKDIHLALHTNAGGGKGTEIYYYGGSEAGKALAVSIYNEVAPLTPNTDRGVKTGNGLLEINATKGVAVLLEVIFHDHYQESQWMMQHMESTAKAIVNGVCRYANKPFKTGVEVVTPKPVVKKNTFYRVVAGSYVTEENAEMQKEKLKRLGIESFIDVYQK